MLTDCVLWQFDIVEWYGILVRVYTYMTECKQSVDFFRDREVELKLCMAVELTVSWVWQ